MSVKYSFLAEKSVRFQKVIIFTVFSIGLDKIHLYLK